MKKTTLIALTGLALGASATAFAGSVKTGADGDLTLSGGASGGYFYGTGAIPGDKNVLPADKGSFVVSDFLLNFASDDAKVGGVSFVAGFGQLSQVTILDPSGTNASAGSSLQYASLTYVPVSNLSLEAGLLATNVGAEVAPSYDNGNITLGALWNSQPLFYPGARASYAIGDTTVYAEVSDDGDNPKAFGAGVLGSAAGLDYALNYFLYNGKSSLVDVVLTGSVVGIDVGLNVDYTTLDDSAIDSALGVGVYVTPSFGSVSVPVRVEYISDGNSGVYGFDSGYTFAITPTINVSKNAFVRVELSVVSSKNEIFNDKDGKATGANTGAAFQMGYLF